MPKHLPIVNTRLTPFACLTCLCSFTFINKHLMHLFFVLLQILLCLLGPVQKSNIVRNEHGHTQRCEFSVIDKKHPFWTNLAQKIKIVSPSYNLVPKPIRICRIHWWWSLFPFLTENTYLFGGKFGPISQNVSLCWNLVLRLIWIWIIQWWCWYFLFLKNTFWANLVEKNKSFSLSWNLVPSLIQICTIRWWYLFFWF